MTLSLPPLIESPVETAFEVVSVLALLVLVAVPLEIAPELALVVPVSSIVFLLVFESVEFEVLLVMMRIVVLRCDVILQCVVALLVGS